MSNEEIAVIGLGTLSATVGKALPIMGGTLPLPPERNSKPFCDVVIVDCVHFITAAAIARTKKFFFVGIFRRCRLMHRDDRKAPLRGVFCLLQLALPSSPSRST